jgi:hypothetical protein
LDQLSLWGREGGLSCYAGHRQCLQGFPRARERNVIPVIGNQRSFRV